jgi:26S proteasome regulatory subunit N9
MESLPIEIRELHERRQWHELTEKLLVLDSRSISVSWSSISQFRDKLNQSKLVLLAIKATEEQDPSTAIVFLENLNLIDSQASLLLKIAISSQYLRIGNPSSASVLLDEALKQVEKENDLDSIIYSHLYGSLTNLHKAKNNPEQFYKYSLQYLAYTPQSEVKDPEDLAYRLAIAVLVAETIYNLGELIHQPILKSLENSKNSWLYNLIHLCNEGKVKDIEKIFDNLPVELKSASLLRKVRILGMMEHIFAHNKRVLSFSELSGVMNVREDEIEHLVMKAMALGLVKGEIDEVDKQVSVSWLQPRVLDNARVSLLHNRLTEWRHTVKHVLSYLEEQSKEILE